MFIELDIVGGDGNSGRHSFRYSRIINTRFIVSIAKEEDYADVIYSAECKRFPDKISLESLDKLMELQCK